MELKYSEIIKKNTDLGKNFKSKPYKITVISNIIVYQIKEILEYKLRIREINTKIEFGDYDNIVQDSVKYSDSNAIIIFWELCNILDGLQYEIELFDKNKISQIIEKTKKEIDFVINNLKKTSLILISKFSSTSFSNFNIRTNNFDELADRLNQHLFSKISSNFAVIDTDKVIAANGINKSINNRDYYSSKSLYTIDYFKAYTEYVAPYFISANGKSKKILILDCDNTLWKGILGENGFDNIEMSKSTKDGSIFSEIQSIILSLHKQGILLCICSKNNQSDVERVIRAHPDMQLRKEHIVINKSNWSNKVVNIKAIAQELNVGLESVVFLDDSLFEVNMIKTELPDVTVLKVPDKLSDYPRMLSKNTNLFFNQSYTFEDSRKSVIYKQQLNRESIKDKFVDIEDYLASLKQKVTIVHNNSSIISRISQMTQKTNQFNLTTKRYTERDIINFIDQKNSLVYAFSVKDKFGDSGVTGLSIINVDKKIAEIDTLLLSCRIIGRNIEFAFMNYIINDMKNKKINTLKSQYLKTNKNEQVKDFYSKCSFDTIDSNQKITNYVLDLNDYSPKKIDYIEVISGR